LVQSYLKRRKAHDEFIALERSQYELGKKHLANIMGVEPNEVSEWISNQKKY